MLVRYEDLLKDPTLIDRIEGYLGLHLDRALLDTKVSGAWVDARAREPAGAMVAQTRGFAAGAGAGLRLVSHQNTRRSLRGT